ncbi:uncharacterized protein FFB14_03084 [Fusarium fujikuroi]|nr:uncharacterized protein FFB14_03084 [Fusarium fujikuroi]
MAEGAIGFIALRNSGWVSIIARWEAGRGAEAQDTSGNWVGDECDKLRTVQKTMDNPVRGLPTFADKSVSN